MTADESPWMDLHGAALRRGCHYKTALAAAQSGELRAYQSGTRRRWVAHVDDVDRWIRGERPARNRRVRAA